MAEEGGSFDSKFGVPEPPVGMGTGFLAEYWQSREPLPRISGMEVWLYYLHRGIRTVMALPMTSMIAVLTIAISLFLFAGFLLILQNVGQLLSEAGNTLYVTAYLKDDAGERDIRGFIAELESNSQIRSVKYVSKERALEIFREDLGSRSGFLEGLEEDNPLPASVDLVFRPSLRDGSRMKGVVENLRRVGVVDELVHGSEWVDKMQGVIKVFRLFGVISLLVALGVIIFLISNTIKLVIYSRRDEISIMQLVGASDDFVRIPFVIAGLFEGFVGSVFGLVLLKGGFALLDYELRSSRLFGVALPEMVFLTPWVIVALVFLGLVVGGVGSLFALGRFMNV